MALPTLLSIVDLSTLRGNDDDDDGELSAQRVWRLVFAERVTSHEDLELIRNYAGTGARGDSRSSSVSRYRRYSSSTSAIRPGRSTRRSGMTRRSSNSASTTPAARRDRSARSSPSSKTWVIA